MNGNRSVAAVVRGLLLGVCAMGVGSCGPSEASVEIFFQLGATSMNRITRLSFVATPIGGDFVGGANSCFLGAGVVDDPSDATVVVENGQLSVVLQDAQNIGPGTVVVACQFNDGGVEANVNVDETVCRHNGTLSAKPDDDCPVVFALEAVIECGNGEIESGEECDDGNDNSNTEEDACRENCVEAFCGDGVPDSDEDCDDGNTVNSDDCSNTCEDNDP